MKIVVALLASLLAFGSWYIPTVAQADAPKYELNVQIVPNAALAAKGAHVIDAPASKFEGHSDFADKDECETHFVGVDVPEIVALMAPLTLNEDYDIKHECSTKKLDI